MLHFRIHTLDALNIKAESLLVYSYTTKMMRAAKRSCAHVLELVEGKIMILLIAMIHMLR